MIYTKVAFFDFDGTLINSPTPEKGKIIYKEKTGVNYPFEGWWGRGDSLDSDIFDIKPFNKVIKYYNKYINDPDCLICLLTNRIIKLKPFVTKILDNNNLYFDEYLFKVNDTKIERIEKILEKHKKINHICVFDDDIKEISNFINYANNSNINFDIYQIINGEPIKR